MRHTLILLFAMNFIRVFDNGVMPAIVVTLKERHGMDEIQLGYLGSLVYIGEATGSLLAMPIYSSSRIPIKAILLTSILL